MFRLSAPFRQSFPVWFCFYKKDLEKYEKYLKDKNITETKDISSTVVRNYIKDKKDITSLVSEKVLKYIKGSLLSLWKKILRI